MPAPTPLRALRGDTELHVRASGSFTMGSPLRLSYSRGAGYPGAQHSQVGTVGGILPRVGYGGPHRRAVSETSETKAPQDARIWGLPQGTHEAIPDGSPSTRAAGPPGPGLPGPGTRRTQPAQDAHGPQAAALYPGRCSHPMRGGCTAVGPAVPNRGNTAANGPYLNGAPIPARRIDIR